MEQHPLYRKDSWKTPISETPEINNLLGQLTRKVHVLFGRDLLSFTCYGSLIWGGFDEHLSDIDLAAVIRREVTETDLLSLQQIHADLERDFSNWKNRIEVQYVGKNSLDAFRNGHGKMANISPGEPLHLIDCTVDWLVNWYFLREYGRVLYGMPRETVYPYISHQEFLSEVRRSALQWQERLEEIRNSCSYQAYAILTLCRACYTLSTGRQVSKLQAAAWMAETYPETQSLITDALRWRQERDTGTDRPEETLKRVEQFIKQVAECL